ncbi:MAG: T9SS type A sorting domain-containing protein [Bacteroidia bacterium]|nr:T9SS type A sorting domain-containing protein [Bacteroidia bacterium]
MRFIFNCSFLLALIGCVLTPVSLDAQFAPAAGIAGSSAIRHDSACFIDWAKSCTLTKGYMDISNPDSGYVNTGDSNSAIGKALENGVVSLGDGGNAILQFGKPVSNGPGWDFAVFENTFLDSFLELAFVDVSSDGIRWVRFPAQSLTKTSSQTGAFGFTKPENVNNLAGKDRAGFGTPFDLEELKDSAGIDISHIQFVKITDVVGSIQSKFASYDIQGRKINDPWPTLFPSSGFDLDAVGVIHQQLAHNTNNTAEITRLYPNPSKGNVHITCKTTGKMVVYAMNGKEMQIYQLGTGENNIELACAPGVYMVKIQDQNTRVFKLVIE